MKENLFIFVVIVGVLVAPFSFVSAQQDGNSAQTNSEKQEELRQELSELQTDIQGLNSEISQKRSEEKSLNGEISILNNQIRKTELELQQTALSLRSTELAIQANGVKIEELSGRIEREKQVIAELLRAMYREDSRDIVEIIMSSGDLSDFFEHQKFLESIQASVHQALQNVKDAKVNVEREQGALEEERENQYRLRILQDAQRYGLDASKQEKDHLLNLTQAQKGEFERLVFQKIKTAEEIRNQLFRLEGADVELSFGEAYAYAKQAGELTGIRPALLLSILKQESSWGANVGQCTLVDPETGMGRRVNGDLLPRVMAPPSRRSDIRVFLQLTQEVRREPYSTLVSCWIVSMGCTNNSVTQFSRATVDSDGIAHCPAHTPHLFGFGGAMGPAQFLPTTWMGYKDRLTSILGHTPDPWDLTDAFTASALKLANGGATGQTYNDELCAARIYFSGSCSGASSVPYGNQVMNRAAQYQKDIDILESE